MEQYCSIWRTAGLQSSCWRGCEEQRTEMHGVTGWAALAYPRFGRDLVRCGWMHRQDLTGQERCELRQL